MWEYIIPHSNMIKDFKVLGSSCGENFKILKLEKAFHY